MRPSAVGYGAGDRDLGDDPNFLMMILGESALAAADVGGERETLVLEFNVDDETPQALAFASERLFEMGAQEVYTTPVHMKKGRSGHQVTVLAEPDRLDTMASVVLEETSTLGLRYRRVGRIELERSRVQVKTRYGTVRVKVGHLDGRPLQVWPEYDDCAAVARRNEVPLKEVQQAALETWRKRAGGRAGRGRGGRSK
jgi:uncharacterized protein (DUF111 family)